MALAATDFALVESVNLGPNLKMAIFTWTPSGTYTSGGEDLTATIAGRLGFKEVKAVQCTQLVKASDGTTVSVAFDHNRSGSSLGKFRAIQGGTSAHTHSFLVKGGQAAAGTDAISIKGGTPVIGKEAVTDATNTGGTNGGVQATTAGTTNPELAAGTDLTAYRSKVIIWGT